jgi:uncharacterized protein DUF6969
MAAKAPMSRARGESVDPSRLGAAELDAMAAAGAEALDCVRVLAKSGDNIVSELLRSQGTFFEWDHYPPGDVRDPETRGQFYYHAHAATARQPDEHGHFHTFLGSGGIPEGVRPAAGGRGAGLKAAPICHLVAISMDRLGAPFRLFTVNRWVTDETWYGARDVIAMLDRFEIDLARPSWPVNRWIGALLRLFRPQIVELIQARDRTLAAWRRAHPDADVFEDRSLEILSSVPIDVTEQVARVSAARRRSRARPTAGRNAAAR